ncbi:hypothetical protein KUTeg_005973 [Tegillarca granosa]|uniref:Uncharacterized protein n=1 Tax=Tegillarca granosa TaxID=220873 RepID=A0ABQ9FF93_TEGGR|nr:hypothetical protein KUTeg_005973 [Tegillarca granosa]
MLTNAKVSEKYLLVFPNTSVWGLFKRYGKCDSESYLTTGEGYYKLWRNGNDSELNSSTQNIRLVLNTFSTVSVNLFGDKFCLDTAAIVTNGFWTEVLTNLAEFKIKLSKYEKTHSVLNSAIWHNSNIKINKNTVYIKKLYDKGIKQIKDLLSAEKNFLTLEMLQNTNQIKIHFTTYEGLKRAIC